MKTRGIIAIASASALVIVGGFVGVVTASALSQSVPTPTATVEPVVAPRITPTPTPTMSHLPEPVPVVEAPPAPVVEAPEPPIVEEPPVVEEPTPEVVEPDAPTSIQCGPGETPSAYDANNNVTACGPDCSQVIVAEDGSETCIPNALPEPGYNPYEPA